MSSLPQFRHGDIGSVIRFTIKERNDTTGALAVVDLSGASAKTVTFYTPARRAITKALTFTTDGTDGKVQYAADSDFFNIKDKSLIGKWEAQVKLTGLGTWTGRTNVAVVFELKPSLV